MSTGVQNAVEVGWGNGRWTQTGARRDDSPWPSILALIFCVPARGAVRKELGSLAGILVKPASSGRHSGAAVGCVDSSHASSLALARGQRRQTVVHRR